MNIEIKLSPKQKRVIKDLQRGFVLITSSDMRGADVCGETIESRYHITNRVFWNLYSLNLIFQNSAEHFNYTLTELGKSIEL